MAANTDPIYGLTPQLTMFGAATTGANTAVDGTGTVITLYTAGASGGFMRGIRVKAAGTNSASVMRIFLNNGGSSGTAANNALIGELPLSATTASNNAAIAPEFYWPFNDVIKATYVINVCFGTAGAAGWQATAFAMDY